MDFQLQPLAEAPQERTVPQQAMLIGDWGFEKQPFGGSQCRGEVALFRLQFFSLKLVMGRGATLEQMCKEGPRGLSLEAFPSTARLRCGPDALCMTSPLGPGVLVSSSSQPSGRFNTWWSYFLNGDRASCFRDLFLAFKPLSPFFPVMQGSWLVPPASEEKPVSCRPGSIEKAGSEQHFGAQGT